MRARWAFILAPIIPAILPGYNWHANHPETGPLSGFIFVTLVFYVVEAVVGIPAFYVLTRRRWQFFGYTSSLAFWQFLFQRLSSASLSRVLHWESAEFSMHAPS